MDDKKNWYASKRFWSNIILIVIAVLTAISQNELFASKTDFLAVVATAISVLNIALGAFSPQAQIRLPGVSQKK